MMPRRMDAISMPASRPAFGRHAGLALALCLLCAGLCRAGTISEGDPNAERVEVTATRIAEDPASVPSSITIVTGEDLRSRGATELRGALALAAGIDIAQGGDGGPAGSVPEFLGLKEFDAFLLVVDGVPWGGAFVPALSTLDLLDVERIEIVRGPAPVMYGATSFVGVIHIIHNAPGGSRTMVGASGGSYSSGAARGVTSLPEWRGLRSTVAAEVERLGYGEDRTKAERAHVSWRSDRPIERGLVRFSAAGTWLRQEPGSPHPREGEELLPTVPVGADHNPEGAHVNEQRAQISAGLDREMKLGSWSSAVSLTRSSQSVLRGFLSDVSVTPAAARGYRESLDITDVYLDTHLTFTTRPRWKAVAGLDHLHGRAFASGGAFDYGVSLDGDGAPDADDLPSESDVRVRDRREFSGLYGQVEWTPADRWRFQIGARLNRTTEERGVRIVEEAAAIRREEGDRKTVVRGSGSAGLVWKVWQKDRDAIRLYASYSDTYKPAVADLGVGAGGEILAPETAAGAEIGMKGRLAGAAVEIDVRGFRHDLDNLVISDEGTGGPVLVNGGQLRLRGAEAEADWRISRSMRWRISYSLHDARFGDYERRFGGEPVQLRGNRQEMSARDMASTGFLWARERGWIGSVQVGYVGDRFLNKRNTALAPAYITWSAGAGYRAAAWEVRLDGTNINDQRPPVAESEIGDAQYYRLPARRVTLTATWKM